MSQRLVALAALLATGIGALLHMLARPEAGDAVWAASTALMLVPLTWSVARTLMKRDVGVDAIALVAMAGSLALGEYLAGAVVALMLAGGNALEASASGRARRELKALVERAPRIAHKRREEIVEEVPVDGIVTSEEAVLDESALTGEPLPVSYRRGRPIRSGTANAGEVFELRATRSAAESAYAGIVRLVREAEAHKAPFVRLADRYAAFSCPSRWSSPGSLGCSAASRGARLPSSSSPLPAR
jgi:cation transport ATPase